MSVVFVEKVTVNIGAGSPGEKLEKAKKLLQKLTGQAPVETKSRSRVPAWSLRPGLPIGAKVTLRGKKAEEFLGKCLEAVENRIRPRSVDAYGNFSFGVREYIDLPGVRYDSDIGMFGFDVCVTLAEKGFRTGRRKRQKKKIPVRRRPKKEEVVEFLKQKYNTTVAEEEA